MNPSCVFCRIASGQIPCNRIYEDESVLAFLDIHPWSEGHTLVIPKAHFATLDVCPAEVVAAVAAKLPALAQAIMTATGTQAYNLLNNNRREAGQIVDHLHFHIIPRRADDRIFSHGPQGEYPAGRAEALAVRIRSGLA